MVPPSLPEELERECGPRQSRRDKPNYHVHRQTASVFNIPDPKPTALTPQPYIGDNRTLQNRTYYTVTESTHYVRTSNTRKPPPLSPPFSPKTMRCHRRVALPQHRHPHPRQRSLSNKRRRVVVPLSPSIPPAHPCRCRRRHVFPGELPAMVRVIRRSENKPPSSMDLGGEAGQVAGYPDARGGG